MQVPTKRIVVAAGGTGGHLFPAQAFATEMIEQRIEVLFAGSGLATNPYFQKDHFAFCEVSSSTPFRKGLTFKLKALYSLFKGVVQSLRLLRKTKPDLVIGFGSFHSFPVMLAAVILRVPLIIFESNAIPGRVNRLFSRWSLCSAVQFSLASAHLSGSVQEVAMPFRKKQTEIDKDMLKNTVADTVKDTVEDTLKDTLKDKALAYYDLPLGQLTLLVFGGSQGAAAVNRLFCEAAALLKEKGEAFQVIHFTGNEKAALELQEKYAELKISARVKPFEKKMEYAWKAADFAICRSGAATLAELVAFEVPALLIPYPYATDNHQKKNALFLEQKVGGAFCRDESQLSKESFANAISELLDPEKRNAMRKNIIGFKQKENKQSLSTFIFNTLNNL